MRSEVGAFWTGSRCVTVRLRVVFFFFELAVKGRLAVFFEDAVLRVACDERVELFEETELHESPAGCEARLAAGTKGAANTTNQAECKTRIETGFIDLSPVLRFRF